jgi:acyl-ACP thioesterase
MYGHHEKLDMEYKPRKILPLKNQRRVEESFKIRKADLDTNGHVNNAKYIGMALEYIEETQNITSMRVDYRKAAFYGDCIVPVVFEDDNKTIIELRNPADEIFVVVEFEKKEI